VQAVSDLGGLRGLGPVVREEDEPVFHAPWEGRIFGIANVLIGKQLFPVDEFRHQIETIDASAYAGTSYYAHWIWGIERIVVGRGILSEEEIDAQMRELGRHPETPVPRKEEPEFTKIALTVFKELGDTPRRDIDASQRFAVGERVLAVGADSTGHTRLPTYVRGLTGTIESCDGAFVFPDTNAHGAGENPEWTYTVRFESEDVWGNVAEARAPVYVGIWESYLQPAA
jgi:nitrile hydratase subunit beta